MANIVRINGKAVKDLAAAADIIAINAEIGDLSDLDTTDKSSLVAAINEAAQSGGGGTSDYNDLANKPSINNVTLTGDKSLSDLGIASTNDVNAKYTKPSGGIPASDLASAVQTSLDKADTALQTAPVTSVNGQTGAVVLDASDVGAGTYSKPSGGIPASDLASSVQTSLGKADTALQTAPVASVAGKTGVVTLDAGDVEYDDTDTYAAGTVGAGLADLKSAISYGETSMSYSLENGGINGSGTPFGETSGTYMRFADYFETSKGSNIVFNAKGGNLGYYALYAVYYDSSKTFVLREETDVGYSIKTNYAYFKLSYYARNGNDEAMYRSWITWTTTGTIKDAVDDLYHPFTFSKVGDVMTIENEKAVFTVQKIVNQSININTWRLYKGDLKSSTGLFNMWTGSDAEGAIKLVGESDFIGGFHGDETMNSIKVFVDGKPTDISNNITPIKCDTVEIYVNSNVYHCDSETQAFTRNKRLLFDKDGVTIGNCYTASEALNVQQASLAFFQCYRADSDENEILHGYSVNSDYAFYDIDDTSTHPSNSTSITSAEYVTDYGIVKCSITQIDQRYAQYYFSDVSIGTLTAQDRMKIYFNTIRNTTEGVSISANDSIIGEFRLTIE